MSLVRHIEVHNGQDHEYERLQQNDENVKYRPGPLQHAANNSPHQAATVEQGDEDENHLAGIQVTEQSQRQHK